MVLGARVLAEPARVRAGARCDLPRRVPRTGPRGAPGAGDVARAVAPLPGGVRRRPDQAPRRPVLAGPHVPAVPPRDPTDAQPAELVVPSPARVAAQGGGAGEPRRTARRALRTLRA